MGVILIRIDPEKERMWCELCLKHGLNEDDMFLKLISEQKEVDEMVKKLLDTSNAPDSWQTRFV